MNSIDLPNTLYLWVFPAIITIFQYHYCPLLLPDFTIHTAVAEMIFDSSKKEDISEIVHLISWPPHPSSGMWAFLRSYSLQLRQILVSCRSQDIPALVVWVVFWCLSLFALCGKYEKDLRCNALRLGVIVHTSNWDAFVVALVVFFSQLLDCDPSSETFHIYLSHSII